MLRLRNRIQNYDWGSHTAIADLLGAERPSPLPEAELWMGAHPNAPSEIATDGSWTSLLDVLASSPKEELGPRSVAAFGARLPFLLKVIAAEVPLSLQAHPNAPQAREGFASEESRRLPVRSPNRNYRDPWHKPELLCALSPFSALVGFRSVDATLRIFDAIGVAELEPWLAPLRARPDHAELEALFTRLLHARGPVAHGLCAATVSAAQRLSDAKGEIGDVARCCLDLGGRFADDPGVIALWLMNWIRLEPLEAIFLPPQCLHAYIGGVGIELMASSDNVLRAGLTTKHVDVPELIRVLDFTPRPIEKVETRRDTAETFYLAPAPEFRLSRVDLPNAGSYRPADRRGCEILLAVEGRFELSGDDHPRSLKAPRSRPAPLVLERGQSVFVSARDGHYTVSGEGRLFRATLGEDANHDS